MNVYRSIVLRSGKGIAGNTPYSLCRRTAVTMGGCYDSGRVKGVLLIGYRTPCTIAGEVIILTQQIADQVGTLLSS